MCGIAGIFHYAEPDRDIDVRLLTSMTRRIAHRGPDGEGFHCERGLGLGHRRLAIVDPSPAGAQPMGNASGTCWLAYNGEFYDHRSHRARLAGKGHVFRGTCDTETLLYLLEQDGPDALGAIAGIFALAFWDRRRRQLILARDPLGVKQLYYHDDGRRVVFASEIKALLACADVPRAADPEAIAQYLHFHTPLFERTFFKHIRQLRAGEYLCISAHATRVTTYWSIREIAAAASTPRDRVRELREQLAAIVDEQLMADVPVGSFFSGGIDSCAVATFASAAGRPPRCFGVHFSNQGVLDERPYQEAAARRLGLAVDLITLDGSSFPDDLFRLMYHQDQPVIGPAMFPMYYVSRLAAEHVKVCLGGQGADETFGGYARYGLTRPLAVARSWYNGRGSALVSGRTAATSRVTGNLIRQLRDRSNLRRLWGALAVRDWESRYFNHMAKVPARAWQRLFSAKEMCDREPCRQTFFDTLRRTEAADPLAKVLFWDVQTYLTGLFQQDDRMSMAVGLESRVPFADPRLVRFAFETGSELKLRAGATKWILRQAVSDVLPPAVLNRRKAGFDTPIALWMRNLHGDFVRDVLLSARSRTRGILDAVEVAALLEAPDEPFWVDVVWKLLAIETWAALFLDERRASEESAALPLAVNSNDPRSLAADEVGIRFDARHAVKEVMELGCRGAVARAVWEMKVRVAGRVAAAVRHPTPLPTDAGAPGHCAGGDLPRCFGAAANVVAEIGPRLPPEAIARLCAQARDATSGRILSFGRWVADYGRPIDWHRNPHNGRRWSSERPALSCLTDRDETGDVKLIWEAARFPHAYVLGRAAAFAPEAAPELCRSLEQDICGFTRENRYDRGIHWSSGQEIAIRALAWVFAVNTFSSLGVDVREMTQRVLRYLRESGQHLYARIDFARQLVNNNHLISEALGLYLAGSAWEDEEAVAWRRVGRTLLTEEAERQFYPDGAYLQHSHNYHRSVLQLYMCATALACRASASPPSSWRAAMERSLDFLLAHQNVSDGRLPNYGANDGSMPCVLTTCDFVDFRPVLQSVSIATRGERLYDRGPWDEEPAWLCDPAALLGAPLRQPTRKSVTFTSSGYHVLRSRTGTSFLAFRCGSLRHRFSQIDMLHADVWWRGHNVLVDAGTYLYNGPRVWHDHFTETAAHNTVLVDGRDQMLHYRKFKNLFWTRAALRRFEERDTWAICEGEHYGYGRHPGGCVHRRSILFARDELWIVVDTIAGRGVHRARLHWLGGPFSYEFDREAAQLALDTPSGMFSITVRDEAALPPDADVVAGGNEPPRGWLSRYYGEKIAAPSLAAERQHDLPISFVSVLCSGRPQIHVTRSQWRVRSDQVAVEFQIVDGSIRLQHC